MATTSQGAWPLEIRKSKSKTNAKMQVRVIETKPKEFAFRVSDF